MILFSWKYYHEQFSVKVTAFLLLYKKNFFQHFYDDDFHLSGNGNDVNKKTEKQQEQQKIRLTEWIFALNYLEICFKTH